MNIGKWLAMIAVMLALTGFVMAAENSTNSTDDNATQAQALKVRYDQLTCKVEFTNTQIDMLNKYVSVNQTANKDRLLADMTALKVFMNNNNREGFDNFTTDTIRVDLQNASQDLTNVKKNFKQYNVSNESKTAFTTELKSARDAYTKCVDDKEIKMAKITETHMDNWNRQWGNIVNKMAEKNITMEDAKALQAEIAAKNAQLTALIASGNITQIREFMKAYHQDQLLYATRFEIARLKGYRDKLEPIADRYNMSNRLHEIDAKIADAENFTKQGKGIGQFKNSWEDIKNAGKDMQNAAKEINAERMKEKQGKMIGIQRRAGDAQKIMPQRGQGPGSRPGDLNNNNNSD